MMRRNKLQFAAATFAVTILMLAVAVSSWQAVRATRAERKAEGQAKLANEQTEIARAMKDFLTEQLLGTVNPFTEPTPDPNKRPLLERIARQLEGKFPHQPLIEAQLRFARGDAFDGIGDKASSAAQFEKCFEIRRRVLTLEHSDTLAAAASLANIYVSTGRKAEAQKVLTETMAVVRTPPHGLSKGAGHVLFQQGYLIFRDRLPEKALPYLKEGLALLKRHLDSKDPNLIGRTLCR